MDKLSKKRRSWNMSRIRSGDTAPERVVRSTLHRLGFRFRLHVKNLPGRPDIVLPKWRTVIFVHGCFWHRHSRCKFAYTPKSNQLFWNAKFCENKERDCRNVRQLRRDGWKVIVVWQCSVHKTASPDTLTALIRCK